MNRALESLEDFLPLPKDAFHILISLAGCGRHGYSIMQDAAARSSGLIPKRV